MDHPVLVPVLQLNTELPKDSSTHHLPNTAPLVKEASLLLNMALQNKEASLLRSTEPPRPNTVPLDKEAGLLRSTEPPHPNTVHHRLSLEHLRLNMELPHRSMAPHQLTVLLNNMVRLDSKGLVVCGLLNDYGFYNQHVSTRMMTYVKM